jgi:hypothetical protein
MHGAGEATAPTGSCPLPESEAAQMHAQLAGARPQEKELEDMLRAGGRTRSQPHPPQLLQWLEAVLRIPQVPVTLLLLLVFGQPNGSAVVFDPSHLIQHTDESFLFFLQGGHAKCN